jgi:hypothetical protein
LHELAAQEVYLADSQYGAKYDPRTVPAHEHVLAAFRDPRVKEIAVVAPTGFGKTTVFEVCISYIVAQDPGPTLMLSATDQSTRAWMESRMLKVLRLSPWTRDLIPRGDEKHDAKKDSIMFRNMAFFTGGANKSNTQEKSMRYVFLDEPWEYRPGIIGEALRRHHNRMNRKMLAQSQGGDEGTEWHEFAKHGKWHDAHHLCPACNDPVAFSMNLLSYEKVLDVNGEHDWPAINESIRLTCPHCATEFCDTDQNRRQWAARVVPVWNGHKHLPDRVTLCFSFLAVWTKTWADIVQKWILANEQKKRGNLEPLRQVINKEFGQFFAVPADTPKLDMGGDPYSKEQFHAGEKWEGEHFRFMTIDVQKGHFWAVIRAWKLNGEGSRLLWEGKVDTWQTLFYLQERYAVEHRNVFIDGRYEIDHVVRNIYEHCGRDQAAHWQILCGEDSTNGYQWAIGAGKHTRKVWKIYSKYQRSTSSAGFPYATIRFSNLRAKDALAGIMRIGGGNFAVPVDVSQAYIAQMASESKVEYMPGKWRWQKIKSHYDNHLWDCEVMGIVAATIRGVLRIESEADPG